MSLRELANKIYNKNLTMESILDSEQKEIDVINEKTEIAFFNNFALTSNLEGIENYEAVLNIYPNPEIEDIELRRARIINRIGMLGGYTKLFLQQQLNTAFGEGNWTLVVHHRLYTIHLDVRTDVDDLYNQTMKDIRENVPANMLIRPTEITEQETYPIITNVYVFNRTNNIHMHKAMERHVPLIIEAKSHIQLFDKSGFDAGGTK